MYKPSGNLRHDYDRLAGEYMKQKDRILSYQEQITSLRNSNRSLEQHKEASAQKDAGIQALKNKAAHLEALADRDGTNTGLPTSQTPVNRKKIIPNSSQGNAA